MRNKQSLDVKDLFNEIAANYDFLNDILSFGLHRIWKRKLLNLLKPNPGEDWVDICCGTGDLTLDLAKRVYPGGSVLGIDYAIKPLDFARERSQKLPDFTISWLQVDAIKTGLASNYFDGAVIAYGLRNLSDISSGLNELHRILKPGAFAGILDFNHLPNKSFRGRFQRMYLRKVVVPIASQLGLKDHYSYLEESILKFPSGYFQEKMALNAGFIKAKHNSIAGGQMGILIVKK